MTQAQIKIAVNEAARFMDRAKVVLERIAIDPDAAYWVPSKHTAALRRASLDLTRALAQMRRPG